MTNKSLRELYEATDYKIPSVNLAIRIGERQIDVDDFLIRNGHENCVIITASNPRSKVYPKEFNQEQNQKLLMDLKTEKLKVIYAIGEAQSGVWGPEESWAVFDVGLDFAMQLAIKYDQHAIVYKEQGIAAELKWT